MAKQLGNIEVENGVVREIWVGRNRTNWSKLETPICRYPVENAQRAKTFIIDKLLNTNNPPPSFEEKGRLEDCLRVVNNVIEQWISNVAIVN